LTHVLANHHGKVVGVDHIQGLVDLANKNMAKSVEGKKLLESKRCSLSKPMGDLGGGEEGPMMLYTWGLRRRAHQHLIDQLKAPGRMFVPVAESYMQNIWVIDKKEDGSIERKKLFGVQYAVDRCAEGMIS
jgi:protein-L-isoaspartate(D-aspartate) O-methyltransferase